MSDTPLHSVSVAAVTFDNAGRVLVIKRRDNEEWQVPGGVLELNESFGAGVVREVLEETGVLVEVNRLSGVYKNVKRGVVALVFQCRFLSGQPTSTPESLSAEWVEIDEAMQRMSTVFAIRLKDAMESSRGEVPCRFHDGVRIL